MIKIEKTGIIGRYNLVNTDLKDDDRYIKQLSLQEVKALGKSIMDMLK